MPLFGSTLTTALAFLPIATLPGPPGEFVGTIAISVILAICSSFALAMSVIPALIGLLRIEDGSTGFLTHGLSVGPLRRFYQFTLWIIFRAPVAGVLLGTALPAVGYLSLSNLPEQFFPASDRRQIQLEVEQPVRDNLQSTVAAVERLQVLIGSLPEVTRQHWYLGGSAPSYYYNVLPRRRGAPHYAQAFLDLADDVDASELVRTLQTNVDNALPDSRVIVRQLEQGPPFDAPIEIRLTGPDLATLQQLGSTVRGVLNTLPDVIHTRSDLQETIPHLTLAVDAAQVRLAGLDEKQLAAICWTTLEGADAGSVFVDEEELPVRVVLELGAGLQQERLGALPLVSGSGPPSPAAGADSANAAGISPPLGASTLASVTTSRLDADVGAIVRIDGQRTNEVKAYITAGVLPSQVVDAFRHRLVESEFALPAGYELQYGGETEQRTQAVDNLIANGVVLFALMVLTLVASFQSFRCAFIIAAVGGLSAGLGPLALTLSGNPFGFMAIVGTMGLVGVAINDSIVVLAAIREDPACRTGDANSMVSVVTGSTRHIIATTLTTIVGFLPLILAGGGFWPPLAITIAGGVAGATLLALYFVPSVHLLLYRRRRETPAAVVSQDMSGIDSSL